METQVTISKKEYDELIESQKILDALYDGGVDSWEWFDKCLESIED